MFEQGRSIIKVAEICLFVFVGLGKKFVLRYVLSGEETESKASSLVSVAGIEGHELMTFSHILEAG